MNEYVERALARAREALRRGPALRAQAMRDVARWEWATLEAKLDRPEPLARERLGGAAQVRTRDAPRAGESADGYGYDERGHIVWSKTVIAEVPDTFHRYFEYQPDGVEIVTYIGEQLDLGEFALIVDGRVVALARVPHDVGSWTELYEYDDKGRLARVVGHVDYPQDGARYDFETLVTYDAAGRLTEIVETNTLGVRDVIYRAKKPSRKAVSGALEELLTTAVIAAAMADPPAEPVYALLLHYYEDEPIPPIVVWGRERHRARVVQQPAASWRLVWNPAEFDHYRGVNAGEMSLSEREPGISVLAADLQDIDPGGDEARTVLQQVCRRLNAADWSAVPVTQDFLVTCVDLHLEHFDDDLKASVPSRALRQQALESSRSSSA